MATSWRSNLGRLNRATEEAEKKGVLAAAYVLQNAVKRALKGGYTSGDFVTGTSVNHVTISQVYRSGDGGWAIKVGTDLMYNLFFELGHFNIFRRKYTRVEKWRPAFMDSRFEMRSAYQRVFVQTLRAAGF